MCCFREKYRQFHIVKGTLTYVTDMLHGAGFFLLQTVIFTNTDNSEKKDWKKSGKRGTIRLMKNIV